MSKSQNRSIENRKREGDRTPLKGNNYTIKHLMVREGNET
jgi:hypothetical protein